MYATGVLVLSVLTLQVGMSEDDLLRFAQRLAVIQILPVTVQTEKPSTDEYARVRVR